MFLDDDKTIILQNNLEFSGTFRFENKITSGVITFPNGDIYKGEMRGNFKEGFGVLKKTNGTVIEAIFENDKIIHLIKITFEDGRMFFGGFIEGKEGDILPHGKGVLVWENGRKNVSYFEYGREVEKIKVERKSEGVNPEAEIYNSDSLIRHTKFSTVDDKLYEGEINDKGEAHGKGILTTKSGKGEKYEGEFYEGLAHGKGISVDKEGNKYEGAFKNGYREGNGRIYFSNGDQFIGYFKNNVKNGKGSFYFNNGNIFDGYFIEDKPNSFCKFKIKDGKEFRTNYERGVKNGKETVLGKNREVLEENEWKNGVLVRQSFGGDKESKENKVMEECKNVSL